MMTTITDEDVMVLMYAADRYVRNVLNPKSLFYVRATPGKGEIHLTFRNLKVSVDEGLKLTEAMYNIRPKGVKVHLSFPDNH